MLTIRSANLLLLIVLCFTTFSANSKNRSKSLTNAKVILIHGFMPQVIKRHVSGDAALRKLSQDYWQDYWLAKASHHIIWNSKKRIAQNRAHVLNQLESIYKSGSCRDGCFFVTHSAGDLVLRDLMLLWQHRFFETVYPHLAWLLRINGSSHGYIGSYLQDFINTRPYYNDQFKLLGSMDFAGAGGGTELADEALATVKSYYDTPGWRRSWCCKQGRERLTAQFGRVPTREQMGIQVDMQTSEARSLALGNSPIPRLRFVGGGRMDTDGDYYIYGRTPAWAEANRRERVLPGMDDSEIAAHSACGSTRRDTYDSCFSRIRPDGLLTRVDKAPAAVWHNHFPLLMGESYDHLDIIDGGGHGTIVSRLGNDRNFSSYLSYNPPGLTVRFSRLDRYLTVQNDDHTNMGDLLLDRLKLRTVK